jgi:hypothetical protein
MSNLENIFDENKLIEMSSLLNENPSTEIDSLNPIQSSQSPKHIKQYKTVSVWALKMLFFKKKNYSN